MASSTDDLISDIKHRPINIDDGLQSVCWLTSSIKAVPRLGHCMEGEDEEERTYFDEHKVSYWHNEVY
jgi:hypothetical protein